MAASRTSRQLRRAVRLGPEEWDAELEALGLQQDETLNGGATGYWIRSDAKDQPNDPAGVVAEFTTRYKAAPTRFLRSKRCLLLAAEPDGETPQ